MGLIDDILGTSEDRFHIGGILSSMLKKNGTHFDLRNQDDTGFINLRVASPQIDEDCATKLYVDSVEGIMFINRQHDGTSGVIPNNTASRGYVVVTTSGAGMPIGSILYDNGLNDGNPMQVLAPKDGRLIFIMVAISGGTITFFPDSVYGWDAPSTSWLTVADWGHTVGAVRALRYTVQHSSGADQDSTDKVPRNSRILRTKVDVQEAFQGGVTMEVRNSATPGTVIMPTNKNTPQSINAYNRSQNTDWGATDETVQTHFNAAPVTSGIADIIVEFAQPIG